MVSFEEQPIKLLMVGTLTHTSDETVCYTIDAKQLEAMSLYVHSNLNVFQS